MRLPLRVRLVIPAMRLLRQLASALAATVATGLLVGCASIGAPVPPSLELPKPPTDLRAVRKGNKVYLFWTPPTKTTDRQNVRRPGPTRICRGLSAVMSECDTPVGNLPPVVVAVPDAPGRRGQPAKPQREFVDALPPDLQQQNAMGSVSYAVEALNPNARTAGLSNQVQVPLAPTLPPPANFKAQVVADGVNLTWDCETPTTTLEGIHYIDRVYRKSSDSGTDTKLADVTCPDAQYQDRTIEWQKSYEYRIAAVTTVTSPLHACPANDPNFTGLKDCVESKTVEGEDSAPQQIFTKDIYPPGVPTGLQAVFSGTGQALFVDLLWAPDTDADLAGYNVYRREEGTQPVKLNDALAKTPAYRDANVALGKTYWYSVSGIDLRGNESARSEETSESIPQTP